MEWLWIFLRYLFPRDHIRQGAEALRHRVAQLVHIAKDEAQLAQLLIDPALRRHLEFMILDAEDCLRLWIAMRGCQIAKQRPGAPHRRAAPHLTHAKDMPDLLARIDALAAACDAMEQRAQAHAARLTQLREADPLSLRAARQPPCEAPHTRLKERPRKSASQAMNLRDRGPVPEARDRSRPPLHRPSIAFGKTPQGLT